MQLLVVNRGFGFRSGRSDVIVQDGETMEVGSWCPISVFVSEIRYMLECL